jgi:arginine/lysine/ornithine decarboxylase
MLQSKTPLYDQLVLHNEKDPISLHVPGHKYGKLFSEQKHSYFQEILKLDATELVGLDDLHSPEGVIREAEILLSQLYNVEKSYFLVNGSTVGNLAMILATLDEEDIVLVQRNCHKSVLNAIQLTHAKAVFLDPVFHHKWGVAGGVSEELVNEALTLYSNVKAMVFTYPNYYGMVNELGKIIALAHAKKIPVLVDEAHGAHFISGGNFPRSAVQLGADVVVQSAHKTLPAMTMGSFLHFNSKLIPIQSVESYLRILQSSSPSYPIMASLDLARSYLGTYSAEDHSFLLEQTSKFKGKLKELKGINVLDYDGVGDLLKVTLQTANNFSGFQMQAAFEKQGIFTELADPYNVLLVLPLLKKEMQFPFERVVEGMNHALKSVKLEKPIMRAFHYKPEISTLAFNVEDMKQANTRKVFLKEALGEIAAEQIIAYPPGIPLLFPGERITLPIIEQIKYLVDQGAKFQGSKHIYQDQLTIFTNKK